MIKFEKTEVVGWEAAIRGMRNPMNSWEKSDTDFTDDEMDFYDINGNCGPFYGTIKPEMKQFSYPFADIGPNDLELMKKLRNSGTDHRKFMRMIIVYVDITAPLYWWKEFDTYKVGTVANSCSTMHKIAEKEFTLDDFSFEHLIEDGEDEDENLDGCDIIIPMSNEEESNDDYICAYPKDIANLVVESLNQCREMYLDTKDKKYWWQLIQLLPSSYNQKRTVMLSYEVLANIYKSRKDHKLDEWSYSSPGSFCDWIANLPYSELITGVEPINPNIFYSIDNPALDKNFMSKFQGEPWNKSEEKEKENE